MTEKPLILLGADHAGFELKEHVKRFLAKKGWRSADTTPERVVGDDYPLVAAKVAVRIARDPKTVGILVCGSGMGMDIAANRVNGVRATVVRSTEEARLARTDDHANILILGGRMTGPALAEKIVQAWLAAKPSTAKRHERRVKELDKIAKY